MRASSLHIGNKPRHAPVHGPDTIGASGTAGRPRTRPRSATRRPTAAGPVSATNWKPVQPSRRRHRSFQGNKAQSLAKPGTADFALARDRTADRCSHSRSSDAAATYAAFGRVRACAQSTSARFQFSWYAHPSPLAAGDAVSASLARRSSVPTRHRAGSQGRSASVLAPGPDVIRLGH